MIESHFLNIPPSPTCNSSPQCKSFPFIEFLSRLQVIFETSPLKALHAIVVLNAKWAGCEVSESEGLGVSESMCPCSFQIRAAKTKFPNPRAWKLPNPTLKLPNPGGAASFRIRRPASFRIRELRSFRIRRAASFQIRRPGSFRIRGPGSFQIRGCSFRIRGAASFRIRGLRSFRIRGAASFRILEVSESAAEVSALRPDSETLQCPDSETPGCPDSETPGCPVSETSVCPDSETPACPDSGTPLSTDSETPG